MKNHVEALRGDRSEFVDPEQATDELIVVAQFVKRRLLAASLPLTNDVKEIVRLSKNNRSQIVDSLRNLRQKGLADAIARLTDSISPVDSSD